MFYCACALTVVPTLVMIPELILHPGSASGDTTVQFCVYLMALPPFIHLCQGLSHERTMPQFTVNRPLDNGGIIVAQWKAMALSTVLSWVVTLLLAGIVILVGDLSTLNSTFCSPPEYQLLIRPLIPVILLGLVVGTWACGTDRVWVGATMGTWIYRVYGAVIFAGLGLGLTWLAAVSRRNTPFHETFFQMLPGLLACLVGLKFFLAQWTFRAALKQRLIARGTVVRYLCIWTLLAAGLLVPVAAVWHRESVVIPLCLGIILMLPLARIGFAPVALDRGRHR